MNERADGIDDDHLLREGVDTFVHRGKMHFQPVEGGTAGVDLEQPLIDATTQINADGTHVPCKLARRLFEGKIEGALTALTCRLNKMSGEAGLSGSGSACHENGAAAVIALATEHD